MQKNEIVMTFADVKAIFHRQRKKIVLGAILGGLLLGLLALLQPIQYTSKGTFLEKGKSEIQLSPDTFATSLLKGDSKERLALTTLKSRKILEPVISKLDLQATIEKSSLFNPLKRVLRRVPLNLKTEYAYLLGRKFPPFEDPQPELGVTQITYTGEVPLQYTIEMIGDKYAVIDDGVEIGYGRLGELFKFNAVSFIIQKSSSTPLSASTYTLKISPLEDLATQLAKTLKITNDYNSKSYLELTLRFPTRHGAQQVLDAIMDGYRNYLLEEHHRLVATQVAYLQQRQEDIDHQTTKLIAAQAMDLSSPANNLELLAATQQTLNRKLLANEMKLKQLHSCREGGMCVYTGDDDGKRLAIIQQMMSELQRDRNQIDALQLALESTPPSDEVIDSYFDGIDLETARNLYPTYAQELHHLESQIAQIEQAKREMNHENFELSALSSVLKDGASLDLLHTAKSTSAALKETHLRTTRELERLQQDLEIQKRLLQSHLENTVQLLESKHSLLKTNTRSLQMAMGDQLQKKIALGEKHLEDYLKATIDGINQEQQIIRQQQEELKVNLGKLPEQWVNEKLINLHLEANGMVLQQLGSLIETKNISDNLDSTLSAPFDRAFVPVRPDAPMMWGFMLFGGSLGAFLTFGACLLSSAATGVKASKANLNASGFCVAGGLTFGCDNDETIRRIMTCLCPQERCGPLLLMLGQGPDYSNEFARRLAKRGDKVVLMSLSFQAKKPAQPGLLQYLEGQSSYPQIESQGAYDSISSGGETSFGLELLTSPRFQSLIEQLNKQYRWIVLTSHAPLSSAEAESLLVSFDSAAITINEETLNQLQDLFGRLGSQKNAIFAFKEDSCPTT